MYCIILIMYCVFVNSLLLFEFFGFDMENVILYIVDIYEK